MTAVLTSGPLAEPVGLADMKAHLRVDSSDEDTLITSLTTAARLHVEAHLSLALMTQSWSIFLDNWLGTPVVELPIAPLIDVVAVNILDDTGLATPLDTENYYADTVGRMPRLVRTSAGVWPDPGRKTSGIEIQITAGHGPNPTDVPQTLRLAIKLLSAHWFENRELISLDGSPALVPKTIGDLLHPFERRRLK